MKGEGAWENDDEPVEQEHSGDDSVCAENLHVLGS